MTIDGCPHDFATLATTRLPMHMDALRTAMETPIKLADFARPGVGPGAMLKQHGRLGDFSGLYCMMDRGPIYVGISRKVYSRLRQHVFGRTHFDASLAYRMAQHDAPHTNTRSGAMNDAAFAKVFESKIAYLRGLRVATVEIEDAVELYLFEVYAALALGTSRWNTFRTH